jgi:hypothetical protein
MDAQAMLKVVEMAGSAGAIVFLVIYGLSSSRLALLGTCTAAMMTWPGLPWTGDSH